MHQVERMLPLIAAFGPSILAAFLVLAFLGIALLGRNRAFLWPVRWPARVASVALFCMSLMFACGLFVMLGPMRPMLDQVRSIQRAIGRPAGELVYRSVADDAPGRLSQLKGKVVLVNLWATWCPPCREELPAIDKLQRDYAARGLVVVTVSNEERARLRKFAETHPLGTLNVYSSSLGWLDVPGRPLSMVIDRHGVVREFLVGGHRYGELEGKVKKYLAHAS